MVAYELVSIAAQTLQQQTQGFGVLRVPLTSKGIDGSERSRPFYRIHRPPVPGFGFRVIGFRVLGFRV